MQKSKMATEKLFQLAKPIIPDMTYGSILAYRRDYRQYRLGYAQGARGEVAEVINDENSNSIVPGTHICNSDIKSNPSIEEIKFIMTDFYFNNAVSAAYSETFELLNRWRLQYRLFRKGYAKGSRGEIENLTSKLTDDQIALLPVSQMKEWMSNKPQLTQSFSTFHVHYGAGKLGIGLILPAMVQSGVPFVIIQRPSEAWKDLLHHKHDHVLIKINDNLECKLGILTENSSFPLFDNIPNRAVGWFAYGISDEMELQFLQKASTISCALGSAMVSVIFPKLQHLLEISPNIKPVLFACENDHKAIDDIQKKLKGRALIIPCMVDRICAWRGISEQTINVHTEPYIGEIVVMKNPQNIIIPPFSGKNVYIPRFEAEARYLCQRKLLLVNGMHTTLAFMTLCEKAKDNAMGSYELINAENCNNDQKKCIWGWSVARCLLLLWEHDLNIIKGAHNLKTDDEVINNLFEYARNTLKRFASVQDTTERVLSGGIVNRYETRLKNVQEFIEAQGPDSVLIGPQLLRKSGIGLLELRNIIYFLVENTKRFTQVNSTATNKKTVEEMSKSDSKNSSNFKDHRLLNILGVSNPLQFIKANAKSQ